MKKLLVLTLLLSSIVFSGYKRPNFYTIDAEKNAYYHNNVALNYMNEGWYYPAIQEFKIAISLSPDKQSSAVYYNNLGECYMKLNAPQLALDCFERAINQFSLNFRYYENLADCYVALGLVDKKFQETYNNSNPLNLIMRGILYDRKGNRQDAIVTLDEFTAKEPDLIITPAVKGYIKMLVNGL